MDFQIYMEMTEKIVKLISSDQYGDVYIGFSLLDKLSYKTAARILRKADFIYRNDYDTNWVVYKDVVGGYEDHIEYIEGKLYSYAIGSRGVYVDSHRKAKIVLKRRNDTYKESWRK